MSPRDHGGGLDTAITIYGGNRADWLDLSTGINPTPYPLPNLPFDAWTALPDANAQAELIQAARTFWQIPDSADILAAPGASILIAQLPRLAPPANVRIDAPTYNEHAAAFQGRGWQITDDTPTAQVVVHPNNPTGTHWTGPRTTDLLIIDESFCDIAPEHSHMPSISDGHTIILKSFGKFWGLAGLRLGFAIGNPTLINQLRNWLGPWPVSGPALAIATQALNDQIWAKQTRTRLNNDAQKLDHLMKTAGARPIGGTPLFRLYHTDNATRWQHHLAQNHIWSRTFPFSDTWLRLGLPPQNRWTQLQTALTNPHGTAGGATPRAASGDPSPT